jgi:crotonobetainyl-CoA:carnitine CoA-transferase CaiB-like acyl-CoA transferase
MLGQHTVKVLSALGYDSGKIEWLRAEHAI